MFPKTLPATSKAVAASGKNMIASQLIVRVENICDTTPTILKYSPGPLRSPMICDESRSMIECIPMERCLIFGPLMLTS